MKKETPEEAAKRIFPNNKGLTVVASNKIMLRRYAFIRGAEWAYSVFGLEEKPNLSVNDRLKMDFIEEHFDKLTLDKLQSLL